MFRDDNPTKDNDEPGIGGDAVVRLLNSIPAGRHPCRGIRRAASLYPTPVRGEAADSPDVRHLPGYLRGCPAASFTLCYLATIG